MSFIRKIKKGDKTYLAEVENRRVEGKVVQRFIRYVGKQADGRTVLSTSLSDVEVAEVKLYGPLLVLHFLAKEIHLDAHLGPYAREILSMTYAHCLDYKSVNPHGGMVCTNRFESALRFAGSDGEPAPQ